MVGDLHVNSTVGLITPTTNLDDGGTYRSSKGQRWLWRNWISFWEEISRICENIKKSEKSKPEVWTVLNGDLVDINGRHIQTQNISQNEADVFRMTIETLEPALDNSDRFFVVRGTAAHVLPSASMEEKIGIDIGAEKCGDNYSWWELLLECESVLFDIRHHGTLGGLRWTTANALNKRAAEIIIKYVNKRCPDVAIQSHNHRYARSSDDLGIEVFSLPAWQLITEYGHRRSNIFPADIGGMYFVCKDGKYESILKRYEPEKVRPWKPSPSKIYTKS